MSIKQLYDFALRFAHERAPGLNYKQIREEHKLISAFLDFIMKSRRDEYRAKGLKK